MIPDEASVVCNRIVETHEKALTAECSDEEFMALFEKYPEFDDLDDEFIEMEEDVTDLIAHYVDDHLEQFVRLGLSPHHSQC